MKISNQLFYALLITLLIISACKPQPEHSVQENVKVLLDSLKSVYAPDTRIALWDVRIETVSDSIFLTGEVDRKEAHDAINKSFTDQFPAVEVNIKLLPENNQFIGALINNSVANLRSQPKHSAEIATQALLGTPIHVLRQEGEWYLVQTPNKYIAWVDDDGIVEINKRELNTYKKQQKVVYNQLYGYSYTDPNVKSQTVSDLVLGCILTVIDKKRSFYQVQYPDKRKAWVKKSEVIDFSDFIGLKPKEAEVIKTALTFQGLPYLWGGTSAKAVDCSGFTYTVYYMNGCILQRDASQQTKYGKEITTTYESKNLLPGDLLFFGRPASDSLPEKVTHVAIYIGNTEFIHASGKVRINSMNRNRKNYIPEYAARFVRAVRIIGEKPNAGMESIRENDFYKAIK